MSSDSYKLKEKLLQSERNIAFLHRNQEKENIDEMRCSYRKMIFYNGEILPVVVFKRTNNKGTTQAAQMRKAHPRFVNQKQKSQRPKWLFRFLTLKAPRKKCSENVVC